MTDQSMDPGASAGTPGTPAKRPWIKIVAVVVILVVVIGVVGWYLLLPPANRAPTISQATVSTESAEVGQSISFTAQATDPDRDTVTYTWDFGDGENATGASTTHTYDLSGRFIALLTVTDGKGGRVTNDASLLFLTVNPTATSVAQPADPTSAQCPTAACTFTPAVAVLIADQTTTRTNNAVAFNGNSSWAYVWGWLNASDHSEGGSFAVTIAGDDPALFTSLTYDWGDGTSDTTGTSTVVGQPSHTFASSGNYGVMLTGALNTASGPRSVTTAYTVRVVAAAPPQQIKNPGIFTKVTFGEPDYLDPAVDYETAGGEVLQNVYETLVWYTEGSESVTTLVPRLATTLPTVGSGISADGLTYTFDLRPGVKFHNGETMTAADVEFSIERVLAIHDPDGPSWMIEQIMTNYISYYTDTDCDSTLPGDQWCTVQDWVDSEFASAAEVPAHFRAVLPANEALWATTPLTMSIAWDITNTSVIQVDSDTVTVRLTHPYPAFLSIAAFTVLSVVSKTAVMANGGVVWGEHNDWMDRNTVGTGPFKLRAWVPNQIITLERWDQYWRTPATVKQVNIVKINDVATRELMLLAGDADHATINRDHQFDVMNQDGTPRYSTLEIIKDKPTFDVLFFGYNQDIDATAAPDTLQVPTNFFADVHIRKAFSYAFDYGNFIENVIHNGGEQLRGPIPRGMAGYNASLPLFTKDATKARTELQAAMNPSSQSYWDAGFTITLYYNAGNTVREQGCLLLKQGLESLGAPGTISVSVRALDWPVYLDTLRGRGLPIFFLGWAPDYADPDDYAFPFLHSRGTFPQRVGYSDATVDAQVTAAARELNPTVREQMYKDLQGPVVEDHVPYLWIYQATNFHVQRSWVEGYFFNPMLSDGYYYLYSKA